MFSSTVRALEVKKDILLKQIKNAKHGSQTAFSFLLDSFWNKVYGFQLNKVKNETEAEDITIETFSKAFDKIHTYNEDYSFSTWLIAISKNVQIDMLRKKNAASALETSDINNEQAQKIIDDSPSPEDHLITQQNLAELLQYIKKLKSHYQEIINLRYFQEMSYKEIAQQLDEPVNNVKVKLLRAKKLLAEIITKR